MYMIPRTPPDPQPSRLRRRVIVELTPDELPLLEAAERRYGTKRQAVVAALAALADAASSPDERSPAASTGQGPHGVQGAEDERRRERDALADALSRAEAERDEARGAARRLERRLAQLQARAESEQEALGEEIAALAAARPSALYCARCERWAPEVEWAWRASEPGAGQVAHHAPCGDHGPGLIGLASWLARRGTPEGEKPTR